MNRWLGKEDKDTGYMKIPFWILQGINKLSYQQQIIFFHILSFIKDDEDECWIYAGKLRKLLGLNLDPHGRQIIKIQIKRIMSYGWLKKDNIGNRKTFYKIDFEKLKEWCEDRKQGTNINSQDRKQDTNTNRKQDTNTNRKQDTNTEKKAFRRNPEKEAKTEPPSSQTQLVEERDEEINRVVNTTIQLWTEHGNNGVNPRTPILIQEPIKRLYYQLNQIGYFNLLLKTIKYHIPNCRIATGKSLEWLFKMHKSGSYNIQLIEEWQDRESKPEIEKSNIPTMVRNTLTGQLERR